MVPGKASTGTVAAWVENVTSGSAPNTDAGTTVVAIARVNVAVDSVEAGSRTVAGRRGHCSIGGYTDTMATRHRRTGVYVTVLPRQSGKRAVAGDEVRVAD